MLLRRAGTFGKVKSGIHLPTGERVAVKILERSRLAVEADAQRVSREIGILKRNRHENVIQVSSNDPVSCRGAGGNVQVDLTALSPHRGVTAPAV